MKIALFTPDPNVQNQSAYSEHRVVSLEEWSLKRKKGSEYYSDQNKYRSRQEFLRWGEQQCGQKFIIGKHLGEYLRSLSVRSVLGLGSGDCYYEYGIKLAAPEITITATDFDPFVVEMISELLPEIDKVEIFDIRKDDFARFQGKYDAILMIGVEYALSNDELVDFFKRVSVVGVNHIIIGCSYLTASQILKFMILPRLGQLKRLLLKQRVNTTQGRFHGWARSKGEFVRLMRIAGGVKSFEIIKGEPFSKLGTFLHIIP